MKLLKDATLAKALGLLSLGLTSTLVDAGTMGVFGLSSANTYFGIFGGAGGSSLEKINQKGAASDGSYNVTTQGAVNYSDTVGVVGANMGYKWEPLTQGRHWKVKPAIELEGYYFGLTQQGYAVQTNTTPSNETVYSIVHPMQNGTILANAVLTFDNPQWHGLKPYVGGGVGGALIMISGAGARESYPEQGANLYYPQSYAGDWGFAVQLKTGIEYQMSTRASIFAEYRLLYVSPTQYVFGQTNSVDESTGIWLVNLSSMYFNMATVGARYDV